MKQTRRPITRTPLSCSVLTASPRFIVTWTAPTLRASGTGAFQPIFPPSSFRSSSTALIRPWAIRSSTPLRRPSSAQASEVMCTARIGCAGSRGWIETQMRLVVALRSGVGGDERDGLLRPRRPRDREAAVLDEHRATVLRQRRALLECSARRAAGRRTGSARPARRTRSRGPSCRRRSARPWSSSSRGSCRTPTPSARGGRPSATSRRRRRGRGQGSALVVTSDAVEPPVNVVEHGRRAADRELQRRQQRGADTGALAGPSASRLGAETRAPTASVAKTSAREDRAGDREPERVVEPALLAPGRAPSALSSSRFVGVVARGRLVVVAVVLRRAAPAGVAQPLVFGDQQQDRATRRAELGLRVVTREFFAPAAKFVDLSGVHNRK